MNCSLVISSATFSRKFLTVVFLSVLSKPSRTAAYRQSPPPSFSTIS